MTKPTAAQLLTKIAVLAGTENASTSVATGTMDEKTLWKALQDSKDVQKHLYTWQPPHSPKYIQQGKNKVLMKMRNVIVNVLERFAVKQDNYNQFVFKALQMQQERIAELEKQLELNHNHGSVHQTSTK